MQIRSRDQSLIEFATQQMGCCSHPNRLVYFFPVPNKAYLMKYLLMVFGLCLTSSLKADFCDIPRRDINDIKSLFERLIFAYDFGYTIFGSKPMSLADICLQIPEDLPIHKQIKARFLAQSKRRLNAWYKHKHEFKFKDFIFLDKEEDSIRLPRTCFNKQKKFARCFTGASTDI